jgi:Cdc6-like AAA superfamily ATPase
MLAHALKARIPLVAVSTDDIVNVEAVLQSIAEDKEPTNYDARAANTPVMAKHVYWTLDEKNVSIATYRQMQKANTSLVVINPTKANNLLVDAGLMPVEEEMLHKYLLPFTQVEQRQALLRILKGLSLKTATETLQLTVARTGGMLPAEVRKTRFMRTDNLRGLIPLETEEDVFYAWPPQVLEWLDTNQKYFESPSTPHKLVPRGLLLAGPAGTGKTLAAREIAHRLKVPLYRLDIAQALNRWQGESENQVVRILSLAEQENPCVVLLDEVEKIFTHSDDSGAVTRILATLLWWLSEHRSRVLTIMTTNRIEKIPPELYRPGRLDRVFHLPELTLLQAKLFCIGVYQDVTGDAPTEHRKHLMWQALDAMLPAKATDPDNNGLPFLAHSRVAESVFNLIKQHNWMYL